MTSDDQTREKHPVLVELKGDFRPTHVVSGRCVLGRSPDCSVWIMDKLVSRRHAEIRKIAPERYQLVDLSSKLGIFVNRERVKERELRPGDEILLGSTLIRFELRPAEDLKIRRHHNRLKCQLPVRVTVKDETVQTVATDISLGGLRLEWGRSPGSDVPMTLEISFAERETPLRQIGYADHKTDHTGLGVRFHFTSEKEEMDLAEAYARLYLSSSDTL